MKLTEIQQATAAVFNAQGIITTFNNDEQALEAFKHGVTICDRSHWGVFKITGVDRLRYLHNQSTNEFEKLQPGQGCNTTFVTSTARTLDLATTYITEDAVLVIVSPNRREQLFAWLDRFIFPFDQVELNDISAESSIFSLMGESCKSWLYQQIDQKVSLNHLGDHELVMLNGASVRLALGSGLAKYGFTLIVNSEEAGKVWSGLTEAGSIPFGADIWESIRIKEGRPVPDRELTEDYNPLEAGLWQTISFDKGCYIGQETIARLNTYNGVKQRLWGIELDKVVSTPTPITLDDRKVGVLTSYTETIQGSFGLGYVRTKAGGEGLKVQVGDAVGKLISVPFIEHQINQ